MKEFIQFCAAAFVVIGMLSFVLAFLLLASAFDHGFDAGMIASASIALGGAGVTLVGGTAYMLCIIYDRLGKMMDPAH